MRIFLKLSLKGYPALSMIPAFICASNSMPLYFLRTAFLILHVYVGEHQNKLDLHPDITVPTCSLILDQNTARRKMQQIGGCRKLETSCIYTYNCVPVSRNTGIQMMLITTSTTTNTLSSGNKQMYYGYDVWRLYELKSPTCKSLKLDPQRF